MGSQMFHQLHAGDSIKGIVGPGKAISLDITAKKLASARITLGGSDNVGRVKAQVWPELGHVIQGLAIGRPDVQYCAGGRDSAGKARAGIQPRRVPQVLPIHSNLLRLRGV